MYAIFSSCGKQYKAKQGDLLRMELLGKSEEGKKGLLEVTDVKACITDKGLEIGSSAKVILEPIKNYRDRKIVVFKMKRRKGHRKTQGHRQNMSLVRVKSIEN